MRDEININKNTCLELVIGEFLSKKIAKSPVGSNTEVILRVVSIFFYNLAFVYN